MTVEKLSMCHPPNPSVPPPSTSTSPLSSTREISSCPECHLPIGGTQDLLLDSNNSEAAAVAPYNLVDTWELAWAPIHRYR